VTVLEARDRVGGRIHSVVDDAWPFPVQLGGWMLSDDDVELRERLRSLGLDTIDIEGSQARDENGETALADDETVLSAVERAGDLPSDVSLADALAEAGADLEDPSLVSLLASLAAATGADADTQSSWFAPALPGSSFLAAHGDLNALIELPLSDIQLTLSSPVVRIAHDESGVSLRLGTGEALSFDRVVVTVPLGVLQQGGIEFEPPLPFEQRAAIASLGMGQAEAIWLRFDQRFWQAEESVWHVVGGDAAVRTWINLHPATGENVLVGLIGGDGAAEFAAMSDEDAVAAALMSLGYFGDVTVGPAEDDADPAEDAE
jgi:monoamine oxidase